MNDDGVRYATPALDAAAQLERVEGEAMAQAWWRGVELRCEEVASELAERKQRRDLDRAPDGVNVERWRRAARLPVLMAALPGFADLWRQEVPAEALERAGGLLWITCRCGTRLELPVGRPVVCPTDDGRWFLRTERAVLVKVWPREAAA